MEGKKITDLPEEILCLIFDYLNHEDLLSITLTQSKWQDNSVFRRKCKLSILDNYTIPGNVEKHRTILNVLLGSKRKYKNLSFDYYENWSYITAFVGKFGQNLKTLRYHSTFTEFECNILSCILTLAPNIEDLTIYHCIYYLDSDYFFPRMDHLKYINLDYIGTADTNSIDLFVKEALEHGWFNKLVGITCRVLDTSTQRLMFAKNEATLRKIDISTSLLYTGNLNLSLEELRFKHKDQSLVDETDLCTFLAFQNNMTCLDIITPVTDKIFHTIVVRLLKLQTLKMVLYNDIEDNELCLLGNLTKLKAIDISTPYDDPICPRFSSLSFDSDKMEHVGLELQDLDPFIVMELATQFPYLRKLYLDHSACAVSNKSLSYICHNLLCLEVLSLESCDSFTDEGLESLNNLQRLYKLNLNRCSMLAGECLLKAKLPKLEHIHLLSTCEKLMPQDFRIFAKNFPNLKGIYFDTNTNVNDTVVRILTKKLTNLQDLGLEEVNITDKSVDSIIKNCKKLKYLLIQNCDNITVSAAYIHAHIKTSVSDLIIEGIDD